MMEWQPIETWLGVEDQGYGYSDGVLLYDQEYPGEIEAACWDFRRGKWVIWGITSLAFPDDFAPTHWMPLPPPPAAQAQKGGE